MIKNDIIWRYLTIDQFEDMLQSSSLFFTHRDRIPEYIEGRLPDNAETQIRLWARSNHNALLRYQFQRYGSKHILSSYDEDNIVQGEINKTIKFLDECFFSCWHINIDFSKDIMNGLGKSLAIKTSTNRILNYFSKKGIYTKNGKISYYNNIDKVNAIKRLDLLFSIPETYKNENEFRILLPLFKSSEIYEYEKSFDECGKKLYPTICTEKEYKMHEYLLSRVVNDIDCHGVNVPFDLSIINNVYIPEYLYTNFEELLSKNKLKNKIIFIK